MAATVCCAGNGRQSYHRHVVGEGDIVVLRAAPHYEAGAAVVHDNVQHTVAVDHGDTVTLIVPASRRPLKGSGHLHIDAGKTLTVPKSDLTLEALT